MKNPNAIESWSEFKSFRSQNGEIFAFEGADKGTNTIYKYVPESMAFEVAFNLPFVYKKITMADNKRTLYIGGEPCEVPEEVRPTQLLACDLTTGTIESIGFGLPKLAAFMLVIAKQKYLHVIPLALYNEKIYKTDIESEKEIEGETGKEHVLEWEAIAVKNPKNYNTQFIAPAWAVEVNDDYIMILTSKSSLLLAWKEDTITECAVLRQKDEFMDGVYKIEGQVCAYGKLGAHCYSIASGKWSFIPQQISTSSISKGSI